MQKVGELVGGIAGSYAPVGSFRFLYSRDGSNGYVYPNQKRRVEREKTAQSQQRAKGER